MSIQDKDFDLKVSIVIPNWNGAHLLGANLPNVQAALGAFKLGSEIVVVDNGSTDNSLSLLSSSYPEVRTVSLDRNYGFARACNDGVRQAQNPVVVFLNNDVQVSSNFLASLLPHFVEDHDLFGVSARLLFADTKKLNFGRTSLRLKAGILTLEYMPDLYSKPCYTLVASGAASAISREKFLELGGFDTNLFYYEDVDLSYRAWKKGWKIVYEPASVVYHENQATSARIYTQKEIDRIIAESRFLFMWKNIRDRRLLLSHCVQLPLVLAASPFVGRSYLISAFWDALKKRRNLAATVASEYELSDKEVLSLLRAENE